MSDADAPHISIVTAFFELGRAKLTGDARTTDFYLDCFAFWARVRNPVVVYGNADTCERALAIRKKFGREELTRTVTIPDLFALDPELLAGLERTMSDPYYRSYRWKPFKPEAKMPAYNYLMCHKPYFVADAVEKGLTGENVAWVDFGYNVNGSYYLYPEEFDFEWRHPVGGKIHYFNRVDTDERPIFEIVRTMGDCFQGNFIVSPGRYWPMMRDSYRRYMRELIDCGLPDSDQTLMIMLYRDNPELFEIHPLPCHQIQSWKIFGAPHLTAKKQKKHKRIKRGAKKLWEEGKKKDAVLQYAKYLFTKLRKEME